MKSKRVYLLKSAFQETSHLRAHIETGLHALSQRDVRLVAESERSKVGDSIDLDAATRAEFPEAHRWDYVISLPASSQLVGIEPHAARESEISVVVAKKRHALEYLKNHLRAGYSIAKWFWVSHKSVHFSRMEPAQRRLNQNGITFVGRNLKKLG